MPVNTMPNFPVIGAWHNLDAGDIGSPSGSAWPSANLAIFWPFVIEEPFLVTRVAWMNGATVTGSTNCDVGVYSIDGTKLFSTGATALTGTNAIQSVDITDYPLAAGTYYVAMAEDNATSTVFRHNPGIEYARLSGVLQMASAYPLPANATFAAIASSYIPAVILSNRSFI